ncbi:hypothetical protein THAOC_09682 [Thalassiosira oceanica]|uniref:Uncharacterized protein n=1 Tax=Thalassiosira oceanica TaxID=159749 RepID=K0TF02_THAOC|nr:hypothetical protein THAOC_09682 [Thalassiosira oceanica]|eukprot:EJK69102.1 hypothetical protein THAOC_09682 [Thalassiosira oceanica]
MVQASYPLPSAAQVYAPISGGAGFKVAPAQMDGRGSRGEQLGKLRAEREAKAIMPGKLRAEREAKAIMKLAGRDKSQWCNLGTCDRIVRAIVRVEVFSGKPGRIESHCSGRNGCMARKGERERRRGIWPIYYVPSVVNNFEKSRTE